MQKLMHFLTFKTVFTFKCCMNLVIVSGNPLFDQCKLMWYQVHRDGKSLQNSTDTTSSLKNEHTKYVQKMLKIVQKWTIMQKNAQKRQTKLWKIVWKIKIGTAVTN